MPDTAVLELDVGVLRKDTLTRSGQQSVFSESPHGTPVLAGITGLVIPPLLSRSSRKSCFLVWQGSGWSTVPWVAGFIGQFPLLIVHVGPSFLKERIESSWWFDANDLPELCAWE